MYKKETKWHKLLNGHQMILKKSPQKKSSINFIINFKKIQIAIGYSLCLVDSFFAYLKSIYQGQIKRNSVKCRRTTEITCNCRRKRENWISIKGCRKFVLKKNFAYFDEYFMNSQHFGRFFFRSRHRWFFFSSSSLISMVYSCAYSKFCSRDENRIFNLVITYSRKQFHFVCHFYCILSNPFNFISLLFWKKSKCSSALCFVFSC